MEFTRNELSIIQNAIISRNTEILLKLEKPELLGDIELKNLNNELIVIGQLLRIKLR